MTTFPTPNQNRELSPYTGYTRAHGEAVADGLLTAAWRWATPRGGLLNLPGRPSASGVRSDGLEGFARTFLAAAFRVAGAGGEDPRGWLEREVESEYQQIRDATLTDPEKTFSNDEFERAVDDLRTFARERGAFVASEVNLARPQP